MEPSVSLNGELIPQGGGDSIPLVRTPLTLGRRESCDISLQFPNVSGKHCELSYKDGFWLLRDLDSTNGTKVNGLRIHKKLLRAGDVITIAKRSYKIQYHESGQPSKLDAFDNEMEEALNMGLLEKAGLERPQKHTPKEKPNPNDALAKPPVHRDEDDDD